MWHFRWGVPSRMTIKAERPSLKEIPVKWIASSDYVLLAMTLEERVLKVLKAENLR
jgi:hypothetical protein